MADSNNARPNAKQKALEINLDASIYGTLAEIGAGQEVARHFFQAGGAAGTIAKTISAYDMTVSDAVYGREESGRYVCEARLEKMLEKEYTQLISRLTGKRSEETKFFAFADTVAARSFKTNQDGHGWLGVRFQHRPQSGPSDVIIHIKMLDNQNLLQQQALGRIGVNLIYAVFHYLSNSEVFIDSLMDNLSKDRIEIDMIKVQGPAFSRIDKRLLNLELLKRDYGQAVLFDEEGEIVQVSDTLYRKNILILRGSFRPPTHVNIDMLEQGLNTFRRILPDAEKDNILVIPEISMSKLVERGTVDNADFLARVDLISALGYKVMLSNKETFYDLNAYLYKLTKKDIAFVLGIYNLESIFDDKAQSSHPFGLLAGIGQLVGDRTRLLVYPAQDKMGNLVLAKDANISPELSPILEYLTKKGALIDVDNHNPDHFNIWSRTVLKMIQQGESGWEEMVPTVVAKTVKAKKLFMKD